ncbi:SAM-dependent methyltransferase [Streptomyces chattanoogensis]|uniref:SAM-dependent methyltransferase n=1 Tax=Streptomyces chattanoogensis TaxID=66876 RepID=UPI0036912F0F
MTAIELPTDHEALRRYLTSPRPSHIYDFLIDGKESYHQDREAAVALYEVADWIKTAALINREFGRLSVETSLKLGIRQFLDLGCGLPASPTKPVAPDLHETVARTQLGCPVVYVDRDPVVFGHAKCELDDSPPHNTTAVHADLLDIYQLLGSDKVTQAFDLSQPVAVTVHDTLPWNEDDAAVERAMSVLRQWMPLGSTLSITHLTDHWHPDTMPDLVAAYDKHGIRVRPRPQEQIAGLFGDLVHQGPGLTATGRWFEGSRYSRHPPEHSAAFAGIGLKVEPEAKQPHDSDLATANATGSAA